MKSEENDRLRAESGQIQSDDPLVSFLYELMRDHVVPGEVERLVQSSPKTDTVFTNGWLALYAKDLAARLRGR